MKRLYINITFLVLTWTLRFICLNKTTSWYTQNMSLLKISFYSRFHQFSLLILAAVPLHGRTSTSRAFKMLTTFRFIATVFAVPFPITKLIDMNASLWCALELIHVTNWKWSPNYFKPHRHRNYLCHTRSRPICPSNPQHRRTFASSPHTTFRYHNGSTCSYRTLWKNQFWIDFVTIVRYNAVTLPQFCSSEPLEQSMRPSHLLALGIHLLAQLKVSSVQYSKSFFLTHW